MLSLALLYASSNPERRRQGAAADPRQLAAPARLAALQPRVPDAVGLASWDINGTPKVFPRAFGEAARADPRRRPDRRRVPRHVPREGYPVVEVPITMHDAPRRPLDDELQLGAAHVPRRIRAARGCAAMARRADAARRPLAAHSELWRDPAQTLEPWDAAGGRPAACCASASRRLVGGARAAGATLLVSREYEHLLIALSVADGRPRVSYMPLPHPSGIAFDARRGVVHVASTRNPNQLSSWRRSTGRGAGRPIAGRRRRPPAGAGRSRFARARPTSTTSRSSAAAARQLGRPERDRARSATTAAERRLVAARDRARRRPAFERNWIQLNSIAAGKTLPPPSFRPPPRLSARRPGPPQLSGRSARRRLLRARRASRSRAG